MLGFLGRFGKGFATIIGLVLTALGVTTGVVDHSDAISQAVATITANLPALISAIGVLLAAFGIGRKAAAAAADKSIPKGG